MWSPSCVFLCLNFPILKDHQLVYRALGHLCVSLLSIRITNAWDSSAYKEVYFGSWLWRIQSVVGVADWWNWLLWSCDRAACHDWRMWQSKSLTSDPGKNKEGRKQLGSKVPLQGHAPSEQQTFHGTLPLEVSLTSKLHHPGNMAFGGHLRSKW